MATKTRKKGWKKLSKEQYIEDQKRRVDDALGQVVDLFESGKAPEALRVIVIEGSGDRSCDKWSFYNRLIMFINGTSDARCVAHWKKAGRFPRKGTHGFDILMPVFKKRTEEDEETGEEKEVQKLVGFRPWRVHPVENTDGDALPDYTPSELPLLHEVAEAWGLRVKYSPFFGDCFGSISTMSDDVDLHTHEVKTFFHELSHAADKRLQGKLKGGQDPIQECVAELSAAALAALYDVPRKNFGQSYEYVRRYAEKAKTTPEKMVMRVLGRVEKVIKAILDDAKTPLPKGEKSKSKGKAKQRK